jgi:hypothetical protein
MKNWRRNKVTAVLLIVLCGSAIEARAQSSGSIKHQASFPRKGSGHRVAYMKGQIYIVQSRPFIPRG